jgi:hypothetical protein
MLAPFLLNLEHDKNKLNLEVNYFSSFEYVQSMFALIFNFKMLRQDSTEKINNTKFPLTNK